MKKNGLIFLLIALWLLTSSREFYLHYSIQKIKQQQHYHITHPSESDLTRILIVDKHDPSIKFEGNKELYYRDTLYDIISSSTISSTKIKYLLLADIHEQNLWACLFENRKPSNHENSVLTFYYKFIAVQSDTILSFDIPDINYFSSIVPPLKSSLLGGFETRLIQPPD